MKENYTTSQFDIKVRTFSMLKMYISLFALSVLLMKTLVAQESAPVELNTVVITATRSEKPLYEVPQRVEVVNSTSIESLPVLAADNLLLTVPGLNVSRASSIFGSASISMRGMGNEQGRVLVLVDGVPVNKGDGGSVNWNAINPFDISRIEVAKGPGSSVYGGNAMGGVVNIISSIPDKPLKGYVSQSIGTFNTLQSSAGIEGFTKKIYWAADGMFRTSDGYISTPADELNEYSVASFLNEYNIGGKAGYLFGSKSKLEVSTDYYSGQRGTGSNYSGHNFVNDEIASDEGAYNLYEVINTRATYKQYISKDSEFRLSIYNQRENYNHIKESLKDTVISRYDVLSVRNDMGILSGYSFAPTKSHKISAGIDIRHSGVDAADTYITSSDKVINKGKMALVGLYVQDEVTIKKNVSLLGGLRFDYADFSDGSFVVENPTKETSFLKDFANGFDNATFSAISPRLSAQYYIPSKLRIFAAYSKGYRPPVLDDMCRTGRISGGMKIANPELKPEYLDNIELGLDVLSSKWIQANASVFFSHGTDYHAYVSTGDSITLNKKRRPILMKSNIGEVELYGAELSVKSMPVKNLTCHVSYSYTYTNIIDFGNGIDNLKDKELVYQPKGLFNTTLIWHNKLMNASAVFTYKGAQWINEINTEKLEGYYFIDFQLWRPVYKGITASISVQNLLDNHYIDSRNVISPGRMIMFQLKYNFES